MCLYKKEVKEELSGIMLELKGNLLQGSVSIGEKREVVKIVERLEKRFVDEVDFNEPIIKEVLIDKEKLQKKLDKVEESIKMINNPEFVHSKLEESLNKSLFNTQIDANIQRDKLKELNKVKLEVETRIRNLEKYAAELVKDDKTTKKFDVDQFLANFEADKRKAELKLGPIQEKRKALEQKRARQIVKLEEKGIKMLRKRQNSKINKVNLVKEENNRILKKVKERTDNLEKKVLQMKGLEDFNLKKRNTHSTPRKQDVLLEEQEIEKLKKRNELYQLYTNRLLPELPENMRKQLVKGITPEAIEERKLKFKQIQAEKLDFKQYQASKDMLDRISQEEGEKYNQIYNLNKKKNFEAELREICFNKLNLDDNKAKELEERVGKLEAPVLGKSSKEVREAHFKRKYFDKIKLGKMTPQDLKKKYKWNIDLKKSAEIVQESFKLPEKQSSTGKNSRTKRFEYLEKLEKRKLYQSVEKKISPPTEKVEDYLKNRRKKRSMEPISRDIEGLKLNRQTKLGREAAEEGKYSKSDQTS